MLHLKTNNESGMVMLITLVVTFLSAVFATSYMSMVLYESRHSIWQKHRSQSFFLAEAGIQHALYLLNSPEDRPGDWKIDENGKLITPLYYSTDMDGDKYEVVLYDQTQMPSLPDRAYLVKSVGIITRPNSKNIERRASCIVRKHDPFTVMAALSILDEADPEEELVKFQSAKWTISGKDADDPFGRGVHGIAIANNALTEASIMKSGELLGDNLLGELGDGLDRVTGGNETGVYALGENSLTGMDAILEDPSLPKNLDDYARYFKRIALDISNTTGSRMEFISPELLGTPDDFQVLYADLSQGSIKIAAKTKAYGVLVLEVGDGPFEGTDFEMAGGSEWHGLIICVGDSTIRLLGGGKTPSHIYGALMLANGSLEMNGTADITYSSGNIAKVNSDLLLFQVRSWNGGWGTPLGSVVSDATMDPM